MRMALTLGSAFHSVSNRLTSAHISMLSEFKAFSRFKTIFLAYPSVDETIGEVIELKERLRSMLKREL